MLLDYFKDIMSQKLNERDTLQKVIENIKASSVKGKIAFYPCSKYSRIIINELKKKEPEIFSQIIGCFDESLGATTIEGLHVYNIEKFNAMKNDISLLVIASSGFGNKELDNIHHNTDYEGDILKTSLFDISLSPDLKDNEIISQIEEVYNLFADKKSKITYLLVWLSRMLKDEDLTYIFENDCEVEIAEEITKYKHFKIIGLYHPAMKRELLLDAYMMKYVKPEKGDIVLDLGAYVGESSIFFAYHTGDNGVVYSFEPMAGNYEILLENIRLNKLEKIIMPINMAVSAKSGTVMAAASNDSEGPWSYLTGDEGNTEVNVTTIDDFVEEKNIKSVDYIKMDVEGEEYNVIMGAQKTIAQFNPKIAISIYHKTNDLITLPLLLNKIGNYQFYLRSNLEGSDSIALYGKRKL